MSETVGLRDLRQNIRAVMDRVRKGERITVTDHNKPIARLIPYVEAASAVERLVEQGLARPPRGPLVIDPITLEDSGVTMQEALDDVRADRDI